MIAHPPRIAPTDDPSYLPLAWPCAFVEGPEGRVVGVLQPHIRHATPLTTLCLYPPTSLRSIPSGVRLAIASRLASLVDAVHQDGQYHLVDLKPSNVLIDHRHRPTLVDLDSVQIRDLGGVCTKGAIATRDYTPPEGLYPRPTTLPAKGDSAGFAWDRFSLAVIIYQLLLGIHPFTGIVNDPTTGRHLTLPPDKIRNGHFVPLLAPPLCGHVPTPHNGFHALPSVIRKAFVAAFVDGHLAPQARPSAGQWVSVLKAASAG